MASSNDPLSETDGVKASTDSAAVPSTESRPSEWTLSQEEQHHNNAQSTAYEEESVTSPPSMIHVDDQSCASSVTTLHFYRSELFVPTMYPSAQNLANVADAAMPDLSAGSGGATRGSTSTSTQQQQQQQRNDDLQSAATSNGLATLLEEETVDHHSSSKYSSTAAGYKNSHSDNKIKKASLKKDDAAYSKSIDDLSSFSKASMISDRSKPSAKQQLQDFNNNSNDKSPASLEMPPSKRQPSLGYQPNPSFRSSGNSISLPGAHATAGIQSSDMVLPAQPIMLEQQSSVHTNGVSNETTTSEHNNNHDNNNHITVLSSNTRQNHNHSQAHPDPEMALRTNNNTYEPEARPVMEQNLPQATPFSTTGNNEAAEETKKDVCLRLSMMANLVMFIMIGIIVGVILSRRSKSSSDSSSNPDDGN